MENPMESFHWWLPPTCKRTVPFHVRSKVMISWWFLFNSIKLYAYCLYWSLALPFGNLCTFVAVLMHACKVIISWKCYKHWKVTSGSHLSFAVYNSVLSGAPQIETPVTGGIAANLFSKRARHQMVNLTKITSSRNNSMNLRNHSESFNDFW